MRFGTDITNHCSSHSLQVDAHGPTANRFDARQVVQMAAINTIHCGKSYDTD